MDFPEADDPLEQIADQVVKKAVKSSPWLALSLAFHACGFALLPLVVFTEKLTASESTPVRISLDAKRIDPDRFYKPMSGGPPSADGVGLDEPTIVFPDALPAVRNESRDDQDHGAVSGESHSTLERLNDESVKGAFRGRLMSGPPGTNDVMGVGGSSGHGGLRYGGKLGGRQRLVARGGGSAATEAAVEAGLAWLARHQEADGRWTASGPKLRCGECTIGADMKGCELGVTALAALAFIGAGYGPGCGAGTARDPSTGKTLRYGDTVRSALGYLERNLEENGRFKAGWGEGHQLAPMYNQAFGTLALCEAYRATRSPAYRALAEKALAWLQNARSYKNGGWRYVPDAPVGDLSVTGACVQALRSAQLAGLPVMEKVRSGVEAFVEKLTDSSGESFYVGDARIRLRRLGAAMPAVGIYVWRYATPDKRSPGYERAASLVEKNVLELKGYAYGVTFTSDMYCWYYAMLALFDAEGPRGAHFKRVNAHVTRSLCRLQERSGCQAGSWDAKDDIYMRHGGGRACATALDVLTLEVYYRYATEDTVAPASSAPR